MVLVNSSGRNWETYFPFLLIFASPSSVKMTLDFRVTCETLVTYQTFLVTSVNWDIMKGQSCLEKDVKCVTMVVHVSVFPSEAGWKVTALHQRQHGQIAGCVPGSHKSSIGWRFFLEVVIGQKTQSID